jgi:ligand-binding sensor domain-containing protein/serine phosphatase RsbU (regulator of sigma subunit)
MRLVFLYLIILFNLIIAQGQNQRFKTLSIKEGLSQSTVNCIIQDKKGLIWLGSQDGLNKFDGYEFTHFKKQITDSNSIPDNNIQSLIEDSKGNIWIGTYGSGIAIYNPISNKFKRINSTNSGLSDDIIMCFIEHKNAMYIGTKRGGLNVYDYNTKVVTPLEIENNSLIQIRDIDIFNNTLYAVTSLGGVHILENSIWVKILDTIQIQVVKPIGNQLWLGGNNGEIFYKENSRYKFNNIQLKELNGAGIWGISPDNSGNLWIGTFGSGLYKINQNDYQIVRKFTSKQEDINSISHDVILSLFNDKDDGIWIGTLGGGVNYFEPNNQKFRHYNDINGLSNNVVMSFLENNNKLYIGTYGGGLNVLDINSNQFSVIKEVDAKIIRCIYRDEKGIIWLGTYGNGLIKYNPTTKTVQQVLKYVADDVWCIIKGSKNMLWLGTWGSGLIHFNKNDNSYKQYLKEENKNSISENTVLSIAKNKEGNLWVGTYGSGLNYFNPETEKFNLIGFEGKSKQETNNKKIRSIYIDKNDDLWIGTDGGGLNYYNNKDAEFKYITTENKLPNNVVYGVIEENNNIWVSTNYGLCKYSKDNQSTTNFDYDDGLQNNEFNQGALYFKEGKVYAGGINGFNIFNSQKIKLTSKVTNTIITSMKVMGKEYNPPIRYIDSLNLHYSLNFLSFQFSYLDYSGKIIYRCMLEGLDEDWVYLDDRNYINYTHLPPGKYLLKFQGKRSGEWNDKYNTLSIVIPPPFWRTIWFYTLTILAVLISLYLFYVFKQRSLRRKNIELENVVKKRTQEIQLKNVTLEEQKREVEIQKDLVEIKHDEIQASITYAKRIQSAILPPNKVVKEYLPSSFILYKPKDIVAGDFYWMEHANGKVLFAAADCTGHGVPGAMVSVVCNNALNRSVREHGLNNPSDILNKTREIVVQEFEKSDEDVKDGMDIALCSLEGLHLKYAGANNPLWIIRNGEIMVTKADKQPIGRFRSSNPYTTHSFQLQKGDTLYIFTDGYADQFGGEKGKKFKAKAFIELLLSIQNKSMEEQKIIIDEVFETWRGDIEQVDDVCIIGVRI